MSCHVCGGLRGREGYNPAAKVILECQESDACIRSAPSYFTHEQRIAAGAALPPRPGCTSNECAIRQECVRSDGCGRSRTVAELAAKVDDLAARRQAVAPTIAKIHAAAQLVTGRVSYRDVVSMPPRSMPAEDRSPPTDDGFRAVELALGHGNQPPSYAAFMDGDARERDVYGQPVDDGRVGTWVQTASGHKLWPLDPRPGDIWLIDIARGLANECRYGRQMKQRGLWYSVAEHCVLVSRFVAERYPDHPEWAREALLHDGDEAYGFGDIPRPLKHDPRIKPLVTPIEERWQVAIFERFGITSTVESRRAIKEIDNLIILDEIPALMRSPELYSIRHPETVPRLGATIACWSPPLAEVAFLVEFAALFPEHAAEARALSADPCAA